MGDVAACMRSRWVGGGARAACRAAAYKALKPGAHASGASWLRYAKQLQQHACKRRADACTRSLLVKEGLQVKKNEGMPRCCTMHSRSCRLSAK